MKLLAEIVGRVGGDRHEQDRPCEQDGQSPAAGRPDPLEPHNTVLHHEDNRAGGRLRCDHREGGEPDIDHREPAHEQADEEENIEIYLKHARLEKEAVGSFEGRRISDEVMVRKNVQKGLVDRFADVKRPEQVRTQKRKDRRQDGLDSHEPEDREQFVRDRSGADVDIDRQQRHRRQEVGIAHDKGAHLKVAATDERNRSRHQQDEPDRQEFTTEHPYGIGVRKAEDEQSEK